MNKVNMLIAHLVLFVFPTTASAFNNPFGLVTDDQLVRSQAAIDKLFDSVAIDSFGGVDNKSIKFKKFKNPNEIGAIVISSGRTEALLKYKELIYSLYSNGYSVYIHDHRGQGFSDRMVESDSQMGHVWDFDNYVEDLKTFYDLKVAPNNHENLFLLAHSMGGGIATLYIEKYPDDFKAAALSSPMHQPDTGILGGAACTGAGVTTTIRDWFISVLSWEPRYALGQGPYEKTEFVQDNEDIMTHSEARFLAIQKLYDDNDYLKIGGISSHWLKNACEASSTLLENAGSVKIPVLVLQAQNDIAVTSQGQNKFCEIVESSGNTKCESGKPVVIPGAYHEMFIESDSYRIPAVTQILGFFKQNIR